MRNILLYTVALMLAPSWIIAQNDSSNVVKRVLSKNDLKKVEQKIERYTSRISARTKKTLTRLCKWENKVKALLFKTNPEAAERLFSNPSLTFQGLLDKLQKGEDVANQYVALYDKHRDELTTNVAYLKTQQTLLDSSTNKAIDKVNTRVEFLNDTERQNDYIQQFIKERRKELLETCIQYVGKSKYLTKINKESFYYIETMRNYKQLFSDPSKAEETVKNMLNKIPAFQSFFKSNSLLSSIFSTPENYGTASLEGLQTRSAISGLIQDRIAMGGPNARDLVQQNLQAAQAEMSKLKNKLSELGLGSSGSLNEPDFKPNMQKTKTFLQRLEFGTSLQFGRNNNLMPGTADMGISVGYKLNDKSTIGIGGSYKLGLGTIERIRLSNQGLGIRSFADWKLKKQFFFSGGFEMNYLSKPVVLENQVAENWQKAGLLGISKKVSIKTKWFKGGKIQLLYDFLSNTHIPKSQPLLFRVGYQF